MKAQSIQLPEFYCLHVHHNLTLPVFLQAHLAMWKGTVMVPLHHPPSDGQSSPVSSPRLCITSAEKSLQPNPLSSHRLNTHGHKQGQEKKKKVWIFMNYLHFPWRKMQQQDGVTVWAGSCSQGHARQVHSQETQLALSVIQPHNHSYCASSAHII